MEASVQTGPAASLPPDAGGLAARVAEWIAAWRVLLQAELALAGRSARALLIAALILPVLLLGLWLSAIALSMLALRTTGLGWLPCSALVCALQVLAVGWLVRAARRWWRDLSLRRSRAVLIELMEPRA